MGIFGYCAMMVLIFTMDESLLLEEKEKSRDIL